MISKLCDLFKSAAVSKLEKKEINVLSIFQEASKHLNIAFLFPFKSSKKQRSSFLISYLVLHGNKDERRPENRDYKTLLWSLSGRYTFIVGNI